MIFLWGKKLSSPLCMFQLWVLKDMRILPSLFSPSTRIWLFDLCQCRKAEWRLQCCWIIPKLAIPLKGYYFKIYYSLWPVLKYLLKLELYFCHYWQRHWWCFKFVVLLWSEKLIHCVQWKKSNGIVIEQLLHDYSPISGSYTSSATAPNFNSLVVWKCTI